MSGKVQGNKTLSGTWGELWVDGEKVWEMSKVEAKVTANREDVQLGLDVDKKKLVLPEPLKTFGTHEVPVKLHKDVTVKLAVKVTEA